MENIYKCNIKIVNGGLVLNGYYRKGNLNYFVYVKI